MSQARYRLREWVRGFEPRVAEGLFLLPARAPRDATLDSLSIAESGLSKKISFDLFSSFKQLSRRTELVRGEFGKCCFGSLLAAWSRFGSFRGNGEIKHLYLVGNVDFPFHGIVRMFPLIFRGPLL